MKTPWLVVVLLVSCLAVVQAQVPATNALPAPTPFTIVTNDANSRVWERTVYKRVPNGNVIPEKHRVIELATGMNYNRNGQWLESKEEIETYTNGAIARQGQYQVIFANNLNSAGAIDQRTPDGKRLRSNILGLAYYDTATGMSVLIAQIQDSQGQFLSANQVLYTNAFEGVKADVRYTYKKGSFEQDIILRERPPAPETFGLDPATTVMEVMTEFLNPPQATVKARKVEKKEAVDQDVSWGAMQLGQGKAFDTDEQSNAGATVPVQRQYGKITGRDILLEIVPVRNIQTGLESLPLQSSTEFKLPAVASTTLTLPQTPLEQADQKPMRLAVAPAAKGYVLDYVELNTQQGDYTFLGDTTYFITADVNIGGTATFEGGTVIKYLVGNSINLSGAVNCQTAAYRPAVFTSGDDNSIGESVHFEMHFVNESDSEWDVLVVPYAETFAWTYVPVPANGSVDNPLWDTTYEYGRDYFVNWYGLDFSTTTSSGTLTLDSDGWTVTYTAAPPDNSAGTALSLANGGAIHDVRISNIGTGISGAGVCSVLNAQFVNCGVAFAMTNAALYAGNILMSRVGTAFYGRNFQATAENVTLDQGTLLTDDPDGSATASSLNLVNSLLTSVGGNGCVPVTTDHVQQPASTGIYQTVGAGSYYLATNSPYRFAGTANINPQLLAGLAQKTTYPPIVYSNTTISVATTLSPQAVRDNGASPDLGYHYDPLDYVFGGVEARSNITFTAGTDVGWFDAQGGFGITLDENVKAAFNGSATAPCWFARYDTVQEGGNGNWPSTPNMAGIVSGGNGSFSSNTPQAVSQFTKFSSPNNSDTIFGDGGGCLYFRATDSEFWGAGGAGICSVSQNYTNCLFFRAALYGWGSGVLNFTMQNCTVIGGFLCIVHWSSYWPVRIVNCTFDGTSVNMDDEVYNDYFDYNAFLANANRLAVWGAHDVTNIISYNWQRSSLGNYYLPPDSPLIDAGSTNANRLGLYHFTTQANQSPEANSIVDIGYHYVALNPDGNPPITGVPGIPDYVLDSTLPVISITAPANNSSFGTTRVNVTGTFTDPYLKRITVNGVLAYVSGNTFEAMNVPLASGANTITATAEDVVGKTGTASITVTGSATSVDPVQLQATPVAGFAPLTVTFQIVSNNAPGTVQQVLYDFNGDGISDQTAANLNPISHSFSTAGQYFPVVTIVTTAGRFSSTGGWNASDPNRLRINVQSPPDSQTFISNITNPVDLKCDSSGNLYVLSGSTATIMEYSSSGTYVRSLSVPGTTPSGLDVDSAGNVYVAVTGDNQVLRFNSSFQPDTTFGSAGAIGKADKSTGTGNGEFNAPFDVAVSPDGGTVSVSDSGNNRIQQFSTTDGSFISTFGMSGSGVGQFNTPKGLTFDKAGYLYIVDSGNNRIAVALGSSVIGTSGASGTVLGQFQGAINLGVGDRGIYVADTGNSRVQYFEPMATGDDADPTPLTVRGSASTEISLSHPNAVATIEDLIEEKCYVADTGNNRVLLVKVPGDTPLSTWNAMVASVQAEDIPGAISSFSTASADGYRSAYCSIGIADLTSDINAIGTLSPVYIRNDTAEYYFERTIAGHLLLFPVEFVKENGVWKISEF